MKYFLSKALLIIVLSMLLGCNENISQHDRFDSLANVSELSKDGYSIDSERSELNFPQDVKIIKSAETRYKVKSVKEATQKIKNHIKQNGGYISNLQFRNNAYLLENKFIIKIPQEKFDEVLDSINNTVEFIDYENISTKDVTEEYVDLESRLKTKLEVKKRYEEILRKKAKTVKEILETEDKLRVLQEEIEATQGKLKYLNNRVAYSAITIELYEKVEYKEEPNAYQKSFWSKTKAGLSNGWNIISMIVLGVINIWPLILLGCLLYFLLIRRRFKKKSTNKN